jgi:hypothetical protein
MCTAQAFQYLRDVAKKYGTFYLTEEFDRFIGSATDQQLAELEHAYNTIDARGDCEKISRWVDYALFQGGEVRPEEVSFAQGVGQLFALFRHLGDHDISPFSTRKVQFINATKKLDWDNVPSELAYLVDPAGVYGVYCTEKDICDFLESANDDDMQTLSDIAKTIRQNGDFERINKWLDVFPMSTHPEACHVYFLLGLLDHAGFKFQ